MATQHAMYRGRLAMASRRSPHHSKQTRRSVCEHDHFDPKKPRTKRHVFADVRYQQMQESVNKSDTKSEELDINIPVSPAINNVRRAARRARQSRIEQRSTARIIDLNRV